MKGVERTVTMGGVKVTGTINDLKEFVESMRYQLAPNMGFSPTLKGGCLEIETAYQKLHKLQPDEWFSVHNETELEKHLRIHGELL